MKIARPEKPIQGRLGRMRAEEFGVLLLGMVYGELSAYALAGEDGEVLEFKLFDTMDSAKALARAWPREARVYLYSNHPQGGLSPSPQDLANLERLPGAALYVVRERECVRAERLERLENPAKTPAIEC